MVTSKTNTPSQTAIWLAMLSVYIAWGSTYLAIRFSIETIPPFLMAGFRFLIAGGLLYLFRRLKGDPAPARIHWKNAVLIAALLLVGANGVVSWAEQRVVSGISALMVASAPLFMVVLGIAVPFFRKKSPKPSWPALFGVALGFVGIIILIGPASLFGQESNVDPIGAAALSLAAFSWAFGSLYSRSAELPESPLLGTGMEMLCGGFLLLLVGTLTGEWSRFDLAAISQRSLLGMLYLVVFGSLVGYSAYTWLIRVAPTTLVSTYAYVNPIVALVIGSLLGQESFSSQTIVASVIIVSAVAIITLTQASAKKPTPSYELDPVPVQDDCP
ncbi:MAG: EamA family transporter [Chloroflexi bacterium]|nr:EamA family transporter [Anaerolineaceae bacterium]NMB88309.1 EamA family transporter [Chloroflexota bacterium]